MSLSMKLLTGALALGLSACALGAAERAPSLLDPSNPAASESPMRAMLALHGSPAAAPPPATLSQAEPPPDAGTPSKDLYVCPMHRDVTSHEPGRCPKCGMKLVLQAPPAPKESASREAPAPGASSMQGGSP
ncbi:hypothetical protein D187_007086 [Cystobacter fuscus DSM 2262]|uniref:Heavy metal binding domain-containing protein n=1 Tax=Cystobacter fuscus (strain ATCC 25194 / DSM 2262 / NBRC 100088 / M29) TaxID=1242864 RepID=S9P542_CYSF2|nr:heavy metal-binding domain-containing protein [Cystobacter fuscus]EPX57332.1 hypothetical protein D187_007086 [Cystobacter fuscus DSM 2262]